MKNKKLMAADDFLDLFYVASAGQDKAFIKAVEMVVEDAPAVDAVPVVRCKDCIEYIGWINGRICGRVGSYHGNTKPDDYCSYGRKKNENT